MLPPSIRPSFFAIAVALTVVLGAPAAHGGYANVILDSSPGSYIGGGKNYNITDYNASAYSPYYSLPDGEQTYETFSVYQSSTVFASLTFSTHMLGIPLQTGVYNNAVRAPFELAGQPGLNVTFYDEGSNMLTGSFTITNATFYKDSNGIYQVASFAATFDQVSDNNTSHVTGSIIYSSTVPEPSSIVLCGVAGLAGLGISAIRRRRVG